MRASFILAALMLQAGVATMTGSCEGKPAEFVSIEVLISFCGLPGPCGKVRDCEGKSVGVKGYIDFSNVFDRDRYPQLPYEKFVIRDKSGHSMEVWAVSSDNSRIFREIERHRASPEKLAHIQGVIVGTDLPIMGHCHRAMRVNLEDATRMFFE